jgi:Spy/CpxP family protein refolding chaperone
VDRLCEKLACSDEQRVRIEGLAERMRAERPEPAGDRDAANRALATAFAGQSLSTADLQAYRAAVEPDGDERDAMIVEAAVELHGILDASQRQTLADELERHGLPFVGGRGRGGKHRGERADGGERSGDDRGAHRAERLCEGLACSAEQQTRLAELLQERPEQGEVPQADRQALALAFRGGALSEEAVGAYLDAAAKARADGHAAMDARLVEVHGVLTPAQRATLGERVAADGPRALGLHGGKGHHGKQGKGGKGKKGGGDRRHRAPQGEAAQFG